MRVLKGMWLDDDLVARYLRSMNALSRQDKFRAYRARKKESGLREVRIWVPDVRAPAFQSALDEQIARINAAEDENDAQTFCDGATAEVWATLD